MRNNDEQTISHFLVTRIRVSPEENLLQNSPLVLARRGLLDAAQEFDLNLGDIVLRGDFSSSFGLPTSEDRRLISDIFDKHMNHAKALAAEPPGPMTRARRERSMAKRIERFGSEEAYQADVEKRQHRARARRAAVVVAGYVEKYGEEP